MLLVLFRIHAVAAALVFLALAVNAASRRDKRAWFWLAAASAYGCAVAITFAHLAAAIAGAVILATSVVAHVVVQDAAAASTPRALQEWTRGTSRRAAKARAAKKDRFSNTG
ncbi:MAG TPA: hypothetical protein VGF28_12435 [Thermoanaerobaculia bacterium]